MCTKINLLTIKTILLTSILCLTSITIAAEPVELEILREGFIAAKQDVTSENQRKDIINQYIDDLTTLATQMRIYKHDIASTNTIRKEIRKAKKELDEDSVAKVRTSHTKQQAMPSSVELPALKTQNISPNYVTKPAVTLVPPQPITQGSAKAVTTSKPTTIVKMIAPEPKSATNIIDPEVIAPKPAPMQVLKQVAPKTVVKKKEPKAVTSKAKTVVKKKETKAVANKAKTAVKKEKTKAVAAKTKSVVKKEKTKDVANKAKTAVKKEKTKDVATKAKSVVKKEKTKAIATKAKIVVKRESNQAVAGQPVVEKIKKHVPQTHVSSIQGLAGSPEITTNNIYTFDLSTIGSSATMAFWATGRDSIDTYGKVWLTTPNNRRVIVGIWKESYFKSSSKEISSFYKLNPITEDISRKVTVPGTYTIEFEWTDGTTPLLIYRVEITS